MLPVQRIDATTNPNADLARLPSLDGIRAVCIVSVLGGHASLGEGFPFQLEPFWPYFFNAPLAVTIFFVLSGFLITFLLAREESLQGKISLQNFYIRRVIRIFPVFFIYVGCLAILTLLTPLQIRPWQYVTSITFTKNFACVSWVDAHLWSLSVEEQFYLFWPALLAFCGRSWRWKIVGLLILSAPAFRIFFYKFNWHSPSIIFDNDQYRFIIYW